MKRRLCSTNGSTTPGRHSFLQARGEFLPLIWLDDSHINVPLTTFGLPSYVGDPRRSSERSGAQEGITCLGAVLGASLVGIDKSGPPHDYVSMCTAWFNTANELQRGVRNVTVVTLPPDSAVVLVWIPAGDSMVEQEGKISVTGIIVDWRAEAAQ